MNTVLGILLLVSGVSIGCADFILRKPVRLYIGLSIMLVTGGLCLLSEMPQRVSETHNISSGLCTALIFFGSIAFGVLIEVSFTFLDKISLLKRT